ncbi:MAG: diacylglycerol kinase family protein [Candidatus Gastranaerophilaceae bacterium]
MSKYSETNFFQSFSYARRGVLLAIKSQKNFIRQLIMASITIFTAFLLNFSILELCILIFAITLVLVAEIFNSAIEFTLDAVYKNKFSKLVGMAKDLAAAAVCIASCSTVLIGVFLFGSKIFYFLKGVSL